MDFGSSAILGAFVASQRASRRERGPVAFRLCLSADLAFSEVKLSSISQENHKNNKVNSSIEIQP